MNTMKVPGGYYIGVDGKPHDANGNPIPEIKTPVIEETKEEGGEGAPTDDENKAEEVQPKKTPAQRKGKAKGGPVAPGTTFIVGEGQKDEITTQADLDAAFKADFARMTGLAEDDHPQYISDKKKQETSTDEGQA